MQAQALVGGYQTEWQEYQYAEQLAYPDQYLQQNLQAYDVQAGLNVLQDPRFMTQEEKDRGLGSVFKRDDQRLLQRREKDAREKDPNFISESYSECYPGYQEYNREIVDSDDDDDLSKMDMGGRVSVSNTRFDWLMPVVLSCCNPYLWCSVFLVISYDVLVRFLIDVALCVNVLVIIR